jgi:hypothetical protein
MYRDIAEFTGSCEKCQVYSGVRHRDELHPTFSPAINFKWMVDIVAMPTGIEQEKYLVLARKYLVLAREDLTNQVEGRALRIKKCSAICRFLLEEVFCRYGCVVVWLFAHDMKNNKLILADYFDARRFKSVRASKSILRHVNRITGIKVTGKIKMEDLANRIAEISHMSRCTSDEAVYRPTLKIILHLRVLSRMQHSYGNPICTFAGTYPEAGGPYLEDCRRKYPEADGRYVSAVNGIPECRGRNVAAVNRIPEDRGSTKVLKT